MSPVDTIGASNPERSPGPSGARMTRRVQSNLFAGRTGQLSLLVCDRVCARQAACCVKHDLLIYASDDLRRCVHTAFGCRKRQGYPLNGARFVHRTTETGAAVSLP
jgi:hypothetical protein